MKKVLIVSFSFISILCVILYIYGSSFFISYDKNFFLDNQNAYNIIAQLCLSNFDKTADSTMIYTYSFSKDMQSLFCLNNEAMIQLNDEQIKAASTVNNTFRLDKHSLECIRVTNDKVIFGIANGRASLIYSKTDAKPDFVNTTNDKSERICVDKITDNWYFACKKE